MDTLSIHYPRVIPMMRVEHIDAGLLAAYLDEASDAEGRHRVEAHLAECADCCAELEALDRTVRSLPGRKGSRMTLPILALGAAAAIGAFVVLRPTDRAADLPTGAPPIVQRSQPEERNAIAILEPATGSVVEAGEIVLRWAAVEPDARYLVTVTSAEGDSVWSLMTADSAAAIPVALEPGGEYLWYVDALLPDGGTASSGIHHFRVP